MVKKEELVVYPVPSKQVVKQSRTSKDKLVIVTGLGGVKLINSHRKVGSYKASQASEGAMSGDAVGAMSARLLSQPNYQVDEVRRVYSTFDTMKQSHIVDINSQNDRIIQDILSEKETLMSTASKFFHSYNSEAYCDVTSSYFTSMGLENQVRDENSNKRKEQMEVVLQTIDATYYQHKDALPSAPVEKEKVVWWV